MSLIVYDSEGYNSWISFSDACAYFDNRLDADSWQAAHDSMKESALLTVTPVTSSIL